MAIDRLVGTPDYTFDGTSKYIPIVFSGKTLQKFYDATILSAITTTDYIGEITGQGDKVIVRTVPNITIRDYVKNAKLELERPESANKELTIDYAKYFNFGLDDIDIKQMDLPMMDKFSSDAAMQMKIVIETEFFSNMKNVATAKNKGTAAGRISGNIGLGTTSSPVTLTKTNILDYIVDCGLVLDEQNVPETDRWIVFPAWATAMLKKSDLKDASLTGDSSSILLNGRIGRIDRFTIYNSNLLATYAGDSAYYIPFGHKMSMCFAFALTKVEKYRPQDTFADAIKGLQVFGYGCLYPELTGTLYAAKG